MNATLEGFVVHVDDTKKELEHDPADATCKTIVRHSVGMRKGSALFRNVVGNKALPLLILGGVKVRETVNRMHTMHGGQLVCWGC